MDVGSMFNGENEHPNISKLLQLVFTFYKAYICSDLLAC